MISHDTGYIKHLKDFIFLEYGLQAMQITPAKRGYNGETWRLDTTEGSYFLKAVPSASHRLLYERSFPVIHYLYKRGITFISEIIKTTKNELYTCFEGATLGVFRWIDGENVQNEESKIQEYQMLCRIYASTGQGLNIPREDFSTRIMDLFYRQWDRLNTLPPDQTRDAILTLFEHKRTKFHDHAQRLAIFSARCQTDLSHFYITHGDAGGNVIKSGGSFHIVDWDDPVYAPPERDAWFCLHWDWAMGAFNRALEQNGLNYVLRPERLAYYCYHSFFWYLTIYLSRYFEMGDCSVGLADELSAYMGGWIEDNLKYADSIP